LCEVGSGKVEFLSRIVCHQGGGFLLGNGATVKV